MQAAQVPKCYYRSEPIDGSYQELFRILATKSIREGTDILRRIQSGDDVETILRHIQRADLLKQDHVVPDRYYQYEFPYRKDMPRFLFREENQYLDSWLYKYSSSETREPQDDNSLVDKAIIYQVPYHAAEMIEPCLDQIKARKWTSIVDDDILMRELLQTYFLTEYTFFPAFPKDYFLQDMAAGRKNYCSPLLVHAVLASACHGYPKMDRRSRFWNPQTLGYRFLAEARRLWELEIGQAHLATIQAAIVLALVYIANGSDEVGRSYLIQAVAAAHAMQLFSIKPKTSDDRDYKARAVTAWGLFGLQAVQCFHAFKAPLLLMPPSIPIADQDGCCGEFELYYPSTQGPVQVNYGHTFQALSELRVIINDVAAVFFSDLKVTSQNAVNKIRGFCIRLDSWYRNLPPDLSAREICFPWQLKIHMHYYHLSIYLLETLCMSSTQALHDESVQKVLSDAKTRLETLLRLYYLRHGFVSHDVFVLSPLSFLGFMEVKSLKGADGAELEGRRSTVVLVAKGLRDQSENCYLARLLLLILKGSIGSQNDFLLKDLEIEEEDGEEVKVMKEQVNSSWPLDLEWIDVDPEEQRLGNLIKKTKDLQI
ncbi:nitrogen assimilation transcription factor nirA [Fusarium beomiforme]|uniref:Nitrogen assimilation transcription factor nirA n=1 Tax=Fusarium beomiforme TaxID=44412 RepID=A0A9P5ATQ1_9HYPO|nr:nitrogen assimilation transcription factor nirA [Fusarium beomiforme]